MGAWIEINYGNGSSGLSSVAPHVGAWIEIAITIPIIVDFVVAPHVGAWIEIYAATNHFDSVLSHPTWVRGLKSRNLGELDRLPAVAPHVGAWIEIVAFVQGAYVGGSHPTWVRGLKSAFDHAAISCGASHPTWVRGLKLYVACGVQNYTGRTPRGCVD